MLSTVVGLGDFILFIARLSNIRLSIFYEFKIRKVFPCPQVQAKCARTPHSTNSNPRQCSYIKKQANAQLQRSDKHGHIFKQPNKEYKECIKIIHTINKVTKCK